MDVQQIIFVLSEFKFGKLESKSLKKYEKKSGEIITFEMSVINHNLDHHYDPDDDS